MILLCFKNSGGYGKDTLIRGKVEEDVAGSTFIIPDQVRPQTNAWQ